MNEKPCKPLGNCRDGRDAEQCADCDKAQEKNNDGGKIQSVVSWSPGGCLTGGGFCGEDETPQSTPAPGSGLARTLCS